ncbi:MAG TPA: alpha/beta fold hydrolase [Anaerolineae bacterium]|nr:alpha/beta fold hydrolase [Anaerolineae bacterium]
MKLTTHHIPKLVLIDHEFQVPLDHTKPNGDHLSVFAREVATTDRENDKLPWLVFLQGGPGIQSPRLDNNHEQWWTRATKEYRVLLLDQRGTGRSTPVNFQSLARLARPQAQADYLKLFRADSIVRDCELIRTELIGTEKWSTLGQSYGGFCTATYLSIAPEGLRESIITGGLPPIRQTPDDVYRATYKRVLGKNQKYYARYPDDIARARDIADFLMKNDVRFPNGDRFTVGRFQDLGKNFGASNGLEFVHYLLEIAFIEGAHGREINLAFLRGVENQSIYDTNPIYVMLQEACYTQHAASNWSAHRLLAEYPQFDVTKNDVVQFTGEMMYPKEFDDYQALRPLKEAANILAEYADWPNLYDVKVLQANEVPVAATIYWDDMYVERAYAEEAASLIRGCKTWVTNEYEHNALRADGERVLDRLLGMLHGNS